MYTNPFMSYYIIDQTFIKLFLLFFDFVIGLFIFSLFFP